MFCIITNQTETNVWLTSYQPLRRVILVTYASSQWREKKFLIEHVVNVKTDDLFFYFFFFIEIENFRDEGKILMRHTHDTTFSEKILDIYKILEESEQFFILFLKKMENLRRFFHRYSRTGPCLVPLNAPPTSLL